MIALDQDLIPSTLEMVPAPVLHSHHDRQLFTVVGVVILLCGGAIPRVE
jgi:hypothetical protein